jgi:hypothetical protein
MHTPRLLRVARAALLLAGMTAFLTSCHHFWRHHHHHHPHHRGELPTMIQG